MPSLLLGLTRVAGALMQEFMMTIALDATIRMVMTMMTTMMVMMMLMMMMTTTMMVVVVMMMTTMMMQ